MYYSKEYLGVFFGHRKWRTAELHICNTLLKLRFQSLFLRFVWILEVFICSTFLFISKIHPNTEIRDRNLSPSKVVTFLYVGTCLCYISIYIYRIQLSSPQSLTSWIVIYWECYLALWLKTYLHNWNCNFWFLYSQISDEATWKWWDF